MWAIISINQKLIRLAKKIPEQEKQQPKLEVSSRLGWEEPGGKEKLAVRTSFSVLAVNLQSILQGQEIALFLSKCQWEAQQCKI